MSKRIDKDNYYLDMAEVALSRSTCLRRNFGAVIVKNDEIVSTGYNGAPRGRCNCTDMGECLREKLGVPRGQRYELCRSVHAEANAIISAPRTEMIDSTLYLVGIEHSDEKCNFYGIRNKEVVVAKEESIKKYVDHISCCAMCKRLVINAGISTIVGRISKTEFYKLDVKKAWVDNWDDKKDEEGY